jgi:hypothetical protein
MSYESKMYLRMLAPCVAATVTASVLVLLASRLPWLRATSHGMHSAWPGLPDLISLTAVLMCVVVSAIQWFKLWRWQNHGAEFR